ncbi:MAG: MFS transporter [Chloroflexi bacterium]|nr:MFS transporter [Chloroflexota bacterium]
MEPQTTVEDSPKKPRFSMPPAFKYPAYRLYWFGTLASVVGFQMLQASQFWLVHTLEDSPLFLGYVGVANAAPAILLNLFGGVFADRLDNRRLIMVTQTLLASLIFLLATLTLMGIIEVWHVLAIAFVAGAVNAFDQPSRQALYPHLIDRSVMMSAVALNSSIWQGTRIVAPAIAGVIIAATGIAPSFYVAGAGFVVMVVVMFTLKVPAFERRPSKGTGRDMLEGVKFIKDNSIFSSLIALTFFNSFFGMAYIILMPVFAEEILGRGATAYGMLLSVSGASSLMTTVWMGTRTSLNGKVSVLIGGAILSGVFIAAFALTTDWFKSYYLALSLMFIIGIFNSMYRISIMSSLQMLVPDQMRGRVMGFYGMTYSMMPMGGMQASAVATVVGTPIAIAMGGLAVSGFAVILVLTNGKIRGLEKLLRQSERENTRRQGTAQAAHASGD